MTIALGRGARLSRDTLNVLALHNVPQVESSNVHAETNQALIIILRSVHGLDYSCRVKVIMSYVTQIPVVASYVFVCWTRNFVLHAKEVEVAAASGGSASRI